MRHDEIALPTGDVLVHAGDATWRGEIQEIAEFGQWFAKQPHKHKIFVAGNHDRLFEKSLVIARGLLPDNITYLQDNVADIDGVRFYGAPWQPKFGSTWAFNVARGIQAAEKWARIDPDTEVLITHGPPYGIGDRARRRATFDRAASFELVGCKDLSERIEKLEKLKLHVFGHIHEGYGYYPPFEEGEPHHINASICDEDYKFLNKPIVFDVD